MSNDGSLEADLIWKILKPDNPTPEHSAVCGGRVYEGLPDHVRLALDAGGQVKPFIDVDFAEPIPKASGRGIGVTEAQQPQVFLFTITASAGTKLDARMVMKECRKRLLGKTLSPNSGQISSGYSRNYSTIATTNKPSRFVRIAHFECDINLVIDS